MDPLMIYILDERISSSQIEGQIEKTQPLTKEQVVDLIISKSGGQDVIAFNAFKQKYETLDFKHNNNKKKHKMFHKDLADLEKLNNFRGTWIDPKELKSYLIKELTSFHIVDQKTVLYNYQIQDWIKTATSWLVLHKKKEYLDQAIDNLQNSFNIKIDSPYQQSGNTSSEQNQDIGNAKDEEPAIVVNKKKIPERWFALLHMIYINMDKYKPFENFSERKFIETYGKENYPIKGTGQMFYKEISRINDSKSIYNYIHAWVKKDFGKWKKIITEISENDPAIQLWIDRNKM